MEWRRIAHRGSRRAVTENTLPAFQAAASAGATWFEMDVWLSRDGQPFVFHDPRLRRAGPRLSGMDLLDIQGKRLPMDGQIPQLEVVVEALAGKSAYVEIKDPNPRVVPAVVDVLARHPGRWIVSSFIHGHLQHPTLRRSGMETMALVDSSRMLEQALAGRLPGDEVGLADRLATPRALGALGTGKPVLVYTVNSMERERALADLGAQGVYTDTW